MERKVREGKEAGREGVRDGSRRGREERSRVASAAITGRGGPPSQRPWIAIATGAPAKRYIKRAKKKKKKKKAS